ncbi:MAG: nuclear transport factor 2 family protein [Jatrophihabitans sp.]|uniref:nuclear transport factor 2 family protein n=1 Tax=Jatrophihabitans sp. TaxID=1932789 RepID=UPI00391237A0
MADALTWIARLESATNAHDIEALVDCFSEDYENVTPAHPERGFGGREQVRRNWSTFFAEIPDIAVRVVRKAQQGDTLWTEWEMSGTRRDGAPHEMRGVILFGVVDDRARWARFYVEPVERTSGNADAIVQRLVSEAKP